MLSLKGIIELLNDKSRKDDLNILRWRDLYYDMSLHIDGACPAYKDLRGKGWIYPTNYFGEFYQWIFENRLYSKHPREHIDQRNWRLSQHRPFTQQPFLQVIQVLLGAIFQDSGFGIDIKNKEDSDYIWGNNFEGKNLVGYISDKFQNICVDPNGVFVVIPREPAKKTTTKKVEPKIVWIPSRFIEYVSEDEIIFSYDSYMWAVNPFGYFRFQLNEEDKWVNVDTGSRGYYGHMLLRLPHHKGGGIWNTQGFYESWLQSGKAWADEFVSNKSAEQLVNKEASHPYIIEASEECPACDGHGQERICGVCHHPDRACTCEEITPNLVKCRSCGGKTTVSINPGDRLSVPAAVMQAGDLVKFISPEIGINEFHSKNNADLFNALYRSLYQSYIDQAQSGVAKDKDMEAKYQFILTVCNDIFDRLIPSLINDILSLRNVKSIDGKVKPVAGEYIITKPTQFQIKTSADLLEEYKVATESKIPDFMLGRQLEDFADKQFGGDDVLKAKTRYINQRDPLALKQSADIQIMVTNGAATKRDWQFSNLLPTLCDRCIREKSMEWFKGATFEEINVIIDSYFATIPEPVSETTQVIDQNKV